MFPMPTCTSGRRASLRSASRQGGRDVALHLHDGKTVVGKRLSRVIRRQPVTGSSHVGTKRQAPAARRTSVADLELAGARAAASPAATRAPSVAAATTSGSTSSRSATWHGVGGVRQPDRRVRRRSRPTAPSCSTCAAGAGAVALLRPPARTRDACSRPLRTSARSAGRSSRGLRADQAARAELRHRRRTPCGASCGPPELGADDVVLEVGPGLGSLTLACSRGRPRWSRSRSTRVLAGALPLTVAERAPELADRLRRCDRRRAAVRPADLPGPRADRARGEPAVQRRRPGAAAPARGVPVAAPRRWSWCRPRSPTGWPRRPGRGLRRAVGQGAPGTPRSAGPAPSAAHGVLAGAQRRLRPGRVDAGATRRDAATARARCSPSSTPPSRSGARRCGPRWPAGPGRRPRPRRRCARPASTRRARASRSTSPAFARIAEQRPARDRRPVESSGGQRTRSPCARPPRSTCSCPSAPLRADGYHDLVTVFQAVGLFDEVPRRRRPPASGHGRGRGRRPASPSTPTTSPRGPRCCSPSTPASRPTCTCTCARRSRWPAAWPAAAPTPRRRWWPATRCGACAWTGPSWPSSPPSLGADVPFALHGRHGGRRSAPGRGSTPALARGRLPLGVRARRRRPVDTARSTPSATGCAPARSGPSRGSSDDLMAALRARRRGTRSARALSNDLQPAAAVAAPAAALHPRRRRGVRRPGGPRLRLRPTCAFLAATRSTPSTWRWRCRPPACAAPCARRGAGPRSRGSSGRNPVGP